MKQFLVQNSDVIDTNFKFSRNFGYIQILKNKKKPKPRGSRPGRRRVRVKVETMEMFHLRRRPYECPKYD